MANEEPNPVPTERERRRSGLAAEARRLKWLDLAAFGRGLLLPEQELHRVRYFTARVGGRGVDHEQPQRQEMFLRADFYRPVREKLLRQSQLPDTLRDARGSIHRPPALTPIGCVRH